MKVIFYFSVLYILTISSIWSFYIDILSRYNTDLALTTNKINGVDYLKLLHTLSIDVTAYQGYMVVDDNPKDKSQRKQSIVENIQKIYTLQKHYPLFCNKDLNMYLEKLEEFKMSYSDYYDFLDYVNHENYIVGNKSEILFSQNKQRYFLGTLMTHYLPEFFISIGIVHNLLEEFILHKNIDKTKKNIVTSKYTGDIDKDATLVVIGEDNTFAVRGGTVLADDKLITVNNNKISVYDTTNPAKSLSSN